MYEGMCVCFKDKNWYSFVTIIGYIHVSAYAASGMHSQNSSWYIDVAKRPFLGKKKILRTTLSTPYLCHCIYA